MSETITSSEVSREAFYAYQTDVEGPFLVELVVTSHVSDTRPVIHDSFRVIVNGEDRWGGFAHHLPENGPEGLGKFVRWAEVGRMGEDEDMTTEELKAEVARLRAVKAWGPRLTGLERELKDRTAKVELAQDSYYYGTAADFSK